MKKPSTSNSASLANPECPKSPLCFDSPHRSDLGDPPESPPYASPAGAWPDNPPSHAVSTADRHTQCSPALASSLPVSSRNNNGSSKEPAAATVLGRGVRAEGGMLPPATVKGYEREAPAAGWTKRLKRLQKVGLLLRVCEVVVCMISFSVMAADKAKGWSGDSYDRYIEYRYCMVVNAMGFVYSVLEACDLACRMMGREDEDVRIYHPHIDFLMDQILAYLLISASSSAATRLYDWELNWGKDKFTDMATVSVSASFVAFIGFASSSIISVHFIFTPEIP